MTNKLPLMIKISFSDMTRTYCFLIKSVKKRDIPTPVGTRVSYRLLEAFSDGGDFSSHHTHLFHGGLVVSQASHKGGGSFDLGQTRQAILVFKNSTGQLSKKIFFVQNSLRSGMNWACTIPSY